MPPVFREIAEKQLEEAPWKLDEVPFVHPGGYEFRMPKNTKVYDPSKAEEPIPGYTQPRNIFFQERFSVDPTYGSVKVEKLPPNSYPRYIPNNHKYLNQVNSQLRDWNINSSSMSRNPRPNEFVLRSRPLRKQLQQQTFPSYADYSTDIYPIIKPAAPSHHNIQNVYQKPIEDDLRLNESYSLNKHQISERLKKREEARRKYQERKQRERKELYQLYRKN